MGAKREGLNESFLIPSYCSLTRLGWSSNLSMNVKVKVQLIWLISGTRSVNVSASVTICFKLPIFFHESIQGWKFMTRVKFLVARFDGKLSQLSTAGLKWFIFSFEIRMVHQCAWKWNQHKNLASHLKTIDHVIAIILLNFESKWVKIPFCGVCVTASLSQNCLRSI